MGSVEITRTPLSSLLCIIYRGVPTPSINIEFKLNAPPLTYFNRKSDNTTLYAAILACEKLVVSWGEKKMLKRQMNLVLTCLQGQRQRARMRSCIGHAGPSGVQITLLILSGASGPGDVITGCTLGILSSRGKRGKRQIH
jgi:hypothetical protein